MSLLIFDFIHDKNINPIKNVSFVNVFEWHRNVAVIDDALQGMPHASYNDDCGCQLLVPANIDPRQADDR